MLWVLTPKKFDEINGLLDLKIIVTGAEQGMVPNNTKSNFNLN